MQRLTVLLRGLAGLAFALGAAHALAQGAPTPRVDLVPQAQWSEALTAMAAEHVPSMPNAVAAYANHPDIAEAILPHIGYIWSRSTLPARHRALLALRTLWLADADYLFTHRANSALAEGLSAADIERVARGPDAAGWDAFEATVIRAGDELHLDSIISDATWAALSEQYDTAQLIDTIDTVGALTMHAGALKSLGVPLEDGVSSRMPRGIEREHAVEKTNHRLQGIGPRIPPVNSGRGVTANVFSTFNHNPTADRVRGAINTFVNGNMTLDPRHRELLLIRIGILCRSEYEYAAHVRVGMRVGLEQADIDMILAGPDAGRGDAVMLQLLRATDELYANDVVSMQTWNTLAETLDTRQMIDMLIAVGGYRSTSLLINSAGVQLDANMADFRFPPELR